MPDTQSSDRPNRFPWPPVITLAAFVAGVVLDIYYPLDLPGGMGHEMLQGVGVLLAMVATAFYVTAFREMSHARTTLNPTGRASHLVTTGPYSLTRNPIYLANFILMIAFGLVLSSLWLFIAAILAAIGEQKLGIEREEAYLERRFGKAWRDYKKKVRRWI